MKLILGDCLDVLPTLEAGSVHCCVTSPPYWALRSYLPVGHDDKSAELGSEDTQKEHITKMVEVFRAVRRVLRDDGTLWLNLGDVFVGKQLQGMPWMVAFALRADGWYLRSDIIWHKPSCMPSSVKDRPTTSHEYLFLLTKSARYFYDDIAIREPSSEGTHERRRKYPSGVKPVSGWATGDTPHTAKEHAKPKSGNRKLGAVGSGIKNNDSFDDAMAVMPAYRNKRSVWTIPTQPYAKAHFATFPEALVLPCILAGTSEEGCCSGCGAPYVRVTDREQLKRERPNDRTNRHEQGEGVNSCGNTVAGVAVRTRGWEQSCECHERGWTHGIVPCTVLDPFLGSGTTAKVAQQYGRSFVGCELSSEYLELARDRFKQSRLFA